MTIKKDKSVEWAGDVFTGQFGLNEKLLERPFNERQILHCLIEMTAMMTEIRDRIDKMEIDLDYHVYYAGDFKDIA